jgi:hypothetical protein
VARTHHQEAVRHIPRQAAVVGARTHRWEVEAVHSRRPGAEVAEVAGVVHSPHPVVEAVEASDSHREVAAAVARPTLNPP